MVFTIVLQNLNAMEGFDFPVAVKAAALELMLVAGETAAASLASWTTENLIWLANAPSRGPGWSISTMAW